MTLIPPPQYDVPPPMPVIEHVLPREEVDRECRALLAITGVRTDGIHGLWGGCSLVRGDPRQERFGQDVCIVYRPDDAKVRQHELAHCAGWPGNHPGGK